MDGCLLWNFFWLPLASSAGGRREVGVVTQAGVLSLAGTVLGKPYSENQSFPQSSLSYLLDLIGDYIFTPDLTFCFIYPFLATSFRTLCPPLPSLPQLYEIYL